MSRDNRSLLNSRSEAKRIYAQRQEIKRLEKENKQLKKQKDDVVEYIKSINLCGFRNGKTFFSKMLNEILRMLGEIDENNR